MSDRIMFTGQYYDSEIGQYYLRARQFDPLLMRFTGHDAATGKFEEPLTLHRYLYCANDPVNRIDLTGAYWNGPWWMQWEFWAGMGDEALKGFAATADGIIPIPFWQPFQGYYANPDGSVDNVYLYSRLAGATSRTLCTIALNSIAVEKILAASPGPSVATTIVERALVGMFWKSMLIENALGQTAGLTWGAANVLLGVAGATDSILGFMDYMGY